MPTIGHILVAILLPLLISKGLNKKVSIEMMLYFMFGTIFIDIWTIIRIFIFPDIVKYIPWNFTHGFIAWIIWGLIFSAIFYFSFKRISKLHFFQIFFILLIAGWLHLGLDMLIQPVRIVGNFKLEFLDFYTTIKILNEQDFIIIFYIIFIVIPIILLIIWIKKEGLNENIKK